MKSLSHVQLLVTPWTAANQAPLSMGFSRQEYWSGVPSPSPMFQCYSLKSSHPPTESTSLIYLCVISAALQVGSSVPSFEGVCSSCRVSRAPSLELSVTVVGLQLSLAHLGNGFYLRFCLKGDSDAFLKSLKRPGLI